VKSNPGCNIRELIDQLLFTAPGERLMLPWFGSSSRNDTDGGCWVGDNPRGLKLTRNGASTPSDLSANEREYLVDLTGFVVVARSAVDRHPRSGEITFVHQPESPGRAIKQLDQFRRGMEAIGVDPAIRWQLVTKVALDSVPARRMEVLLAIFEFNRPVTVTDLEVVLGMPNSTVRRRLQNIRVHHLVKLTPGTGGPDLWELPEEVVETMVGAIGVLGGNGLPDMSGRG
jgi:hypothetical protein